MPCINPPYKSLLAYGETMMYMCIIGWDRFKIALRPGSTYVLLLFFTARKYACVL